MKINTIKLGTTIKDRATGLEGQLIHLFIREDHSQLYSFQPRGLNKEDGQPVKRCWLTRNRIVSFTTQETDLPLEVLGTKVEDTASGFAGTAVGLTLHISGCCHVEVQPAGVLPKTGGPIETGDFDIRRLKGPAIKATTEAQRDDDQKRKPSPAGCDSPNPRF